MAAVMAAVTALEAVVLVAMPLPFVGAIPLPFVVEVDSVRDADLDTAALGTTADFGLAGMAGMIAIGVMIHTATTIDPSQRIVVGGRESGPFCPNDD